MGCGVMSNLQEFTRMAVIAYECGLSEDTLLQELQHSQGDQINPLLDPEVPFPSSTMEFSGQPHLLLPVAALVVFG